MLIPARAAEFVRTATAGGQVLALTVNDPGGPVLWAVDHEAETVTEVPAGDATARTVIAWALATVAERGVSPLELGEGVVLAAGDEELYVLAWALEEVAGLWLAWLEARWDGPLTMDAAQRQALADVLEAQEQRRHIRARRRAA